MHYLTFLQAVHGLLEPARYLEIGVQHGHSLSLARCRAVGIDPAFAIDAEIDCDVALFRTTSDEYFSRADPLAPTGGKPFDLAFIDGLHLFEFALRDFINTERHCSAGSLVIFDDVLPRSADEAARQRHTRDWTGDVYPIIEVLARYRPELSVVPVGTQPTGLLLVIGLDPHNTVLADSYLDILAEFRRPDPQRVPADLLDRTTALPPERVLEASFWEVLSGAATDASSDDVRAQLAPRLARSLGRAFAPGGRTRV
ncbi:MAG TPA: class I SAM-dependent methyltransferase [Actinomycetes bacterium]|nr:class I SAM-dependent methyltransferase [Actinomycetes bacterium]